MNTPPRRLALQTGAALVLGLLALPQAWAHGEAAHAPARTYVASQVEQTDFGREGDPRQVTKTVRVDMSDALRYSPNALTLRQGQTVRFVVRNRGKVLHEMVLGTPEALKAHAEMMKKFPDMVHDDPSIAHVRPGERGEIVWQFNRAGRFEFACLQPGHFEGGMIGKVVVR